MLSGHGQLGITGDIALGVAMSILQMFLQPGGCVAYNCVFSAGGARLLFIGFGSVGGSRGNEDT